MIKDFLVKNYCPKNCNELFQRECCEGVRTRCSDFEEREKMLESYANSEMNLQHITDLLEQAKEIIKEYIRLALQEPEEKDMIANIELFKKAEQFLNDIKE